MRKFGLKMAATLGFWLGTRFPGSTIISTSNLLPTNYSVNLYDENTPPLCSYCNQHEERLHLLLWSCSVVQEFWQIVKNCILIFHPQFSLNEKVAIFGHTSSTGDSPINTILSLARYFIYQNKFTTRELVETRFNNYMRDHLTIIFESNKVKDKEREFLLDWQDILLHFQVIN